LGSIKNKKMNDNERKIAGTVTDRKNRFRIKHLPSLLKETAIEWNKDDPWRLSAVVAYYAILSLPGLLVVIIGTLSYFWGAELIEGQVYEQIRAELGQSAADSLEAMFITASEAQGSWIAAIIGIGGLIFGATAVFYHLQISLNRIWDVKSDPKRAMVRYLIDRAKSFAFVIVIALLLLISFIISSLITGMQNYLAYYLPPAIINLIKVSEFVVSFLVITVLFALIFKYLPDVHIGWRSVWVGAFITSFLFAIGKEILSIYFGQASPGNVYGAAGSMIIVLLWVTYSSLILFFGAEFTWVYTHRYGYRMIPKSHARLLTSAEDISKIRR
jgi:membrane protein